MCIDFIHLKYKLLIPLNKKSSVEDLFVGLSTHFSEGGRRGIRTPDHQLKRLLLYRLSYAPIMLLWYLIQFLDHEIFHGGHNTCEAAGCLPACLHWRELCAYILYGNLIFRITLLIVRAYHQFVNTFFISSFLHSYFFILFQYRGAKMRRNVIGAALQRKNHKSFVRNFCVSPLIISGTSLPGIKRSVIANKNMIVKKAKIILSHGKPPCDHEIDELIRRSPSTAAKRIVRNANKPSAVYSVKIIFSGMTSTRTSAT